MATEPIDEAVRAARGGDPEAFGPVVVATQARLRAFIGGYVPRPEWIDEIAQQAYVSAFRSLATYRPGTDFFAWLRQIAYNHLRAELERTSRRRRLERDRAAEAVAAVLSRRLERDSGDEDVGALRSCLEQLPPGSREIVLGVYAEGLSLADLARRLGRSAGGLKVTLFRLRARLRECVEQRRGAAETA